MVWASEGGTMSDVDYGIWFESAHDDNGYDNGQFLIIPEPPFSLTAAAELALDSSKEIVALRHRIESLQRWEPRITVSSEHGKEIKVDVAVSKVVIEHARDPLIAVKMVAEQVQVRLHEYVVFNFLRGKNEHRT
jgi:hypothetical protein